jgi:chromosome segregation ATPase
LMDSYQLTSLTYRDLELFLTRRYIDDATKARLQKLLELRSQINQIQAKLQALEDEEEKISEDQKRLRENIETLSKTPEAKTLITRYVEKVNAQETRLENMVKERQNLEAEQDKLSADLAREINNFELK